MKAGLTIDSVSPRSSVVSLIRLYKSWRPGKVSNVCLNLQNPAVILAPWWCPGPTRWVNACTQAWRVGRTADWWVGMVSSLHGQAGDFSSFLHIGLFFFPFHFCPLCWRKWTLFVIYILITSHGLSESLEGWRGWQAHRCVSARRLCNYCFIWSCDLLPRLMGCFSD